VALLISTVSFAYTYNALSEISRPIQELRQSVKEISSVPTVEEYLAKTPHEKALIEGSRKEGKLSFYTGQSGPEGEALMLGFQKAYPWIEVEFYRAGAWKLHEKIATEQRARKYYADVLYDQPALVIPKWQEDMVQKPAYVSPNHVNVDPQWHNLTMGFHAVRVSVMAPIVNTKLVPKELWPKDWKDFANPRPEWVGKVSLGDVRLLAAASSILYCQYENYGWETTRKIYEGLAKCKAMLFTGTTQGMEMCISGERPIGFYNLMDRFQDAYSKGAPVAFLPMESGWIVYQMGMTMLKNPPHPNTAKLFIDWCLTEEAALVILHSAMNFPLCKNVKETLPGVPRLEELKFMRFDAVQAEKKAAELLAEWLKIMGIQ